MSGTRTIEFENLWTPDGWLAPGVLSIDGDGLVASLSAGAPGRAAASERVRGFAVPGMYNTHSHAFQRALAGRCEIGGSAGEDNLWTWRERMYRLAQRIGPADLEALAAFAYMEMVEHGFTRVAEFHYLHHAPGGTRYAQRDEMSLRLARAAQASGIGLMVMPTLYAHAGIGCPPTPQQARFTHTRVEDFAGLCEDLRNHLRGSGVQLGMALHSLRAVSPEELRAALVLAGTLQPFTPFHIHVSETRHEVQEVLAGLGARPVQWLLDNVAVDHRWTMVHATHLSAAERDGLARSGATASLCPMTEAMLGDGLFPLVEYRRAGGTWAIGTDSHYASGVAAELRTLETGQRLRLARRNVLVEESGTGERSLHSGERLFGLALEGGRCFADQRSVLVPGARADLVVLDPDSPTLAGHDTGTVLDAWLLSGAADPVAGVMCAGRWVVEEGRHVDRESITQAYVDTVRGLFA